MSSANRARKVAAWKRANCVDGLSPEDLAACRRSRRDFMKTFASVVEPGPNLLTPRQLFREYDSTFGYLEEDLAYLESALLKKGILNVRHPNVAGRAITGYTVHLEALRGKALCGLPPNAKLPSYAIIKDWERYLLSKKEADNFRELAKTLF